MSKNQLLFACLNNNTNKFVELFETMPRDTDITDVLLVACDNGNEEIVKILLNRGNVNPSKCLMMAYERRYTNILKLLINDDRADLNDFFIECCGVLNDINMVKFLLNNGRVDPTYKNSKCLDEACAHENKAVVKLLFADGRVVPSNDCNTTDPEILQLLVDDGRILLNGAAETLFYYACVDNIPEVVEIFIKDGRLDPSFSRNVCIQQAVDKDLVDILQMLLDDGRADPTVPDPDLPEYGNCLRGAVFMDYLTCAKLLLDDGRCDTSECMKIACIRGSYDMVKLLLKYIAPTDEDLVYICTRGYNDILSLLLKDGRVNPATNEGECLIMAFTHSHKDVIRSLLADPRITIDIRNKVTVTLFSELNYASDDKWVIHNKDVINLLIK